MTEPAFTPRPSQQKIVDTVLAAAGPVRLGVSAVPGSGKTHILAYLASHLTERVGDEQEVLIVTLVNAAVDNFRRRIDAFIRRAGLLPGFNYRVCTLHSLAHEIVRQRPSLVGLSQDFEIIDEYTAQRILQEVVESWLDVNFALIEDYLAPAANPQSLRRYHLPELVSAIGQRFIKRAKDRHLDPYDLEDAYRSRGESLPLAQLGIDIYREYQSRLARTGVDFDDLIRLADEALTHAPDFLERLRQLWPYILEDEAQDSSLLQERILDKLAGPSGTWVRVGDPNQAIYETFTTASPEHLRRFMGQEGVLSLPMPESGRPSASIMKLANYLIDWTMADHPEPAIRSALNPPHIEPTPAGDPQPNPADRPERIYLYDKKFSPRREIQTVAQSAKKWLRENPDKTVAILDARNQRGGDIANELRRNDVAYVELLRSATLTRHAAEALSKTLRYLSQPHEAPLLADLFHVWKRHEWDLEAVAPLFEWIERALKNCRRLESYLWPTAEQDWIEERIDELTENGWADLPFGYTALDESAAKATEETTQTAGQYIRQTLVEFREVIRRWQAAAILPIDQLVLVLAQELFNNPVNSPAELALAHKFALVLRQAARQDPAARLPRFVEILEEIARNQRRFPGFGDEDMGFEPPPGLVTVATMHRAKGLEWDRVYLMGLNNYSFPSGQPQDSYYAEKWFVRDSLNLEAEILAQLETLESGLDYEEGRATAEARLEISRERLRLLFVGITRARQELVVTWNTGREYKDRPPNQPAIPFVALQSWWEEKKEEEK